MLTIHDIDRGKHLSQIINDGPNKCTTEKLTKFITFFTRLFCISRAICNLDISERSVSHSRRSKSLDDSFCAALESVSIAGLGVSLINWTLFRKSSRRFV